MDHNTFKLMDDLVEPFKKFIEKLQTKPEKSSVKQLKVVKMPIQGQGAEVTANSSLSPVVDEEVQKT